ncbi:MAG: GNAT family N-acetyltransferase [Candidatus Omnitrophota bacterium]
MEKIDKGVLVTMAKNTGVFNDKDIAILEEVVTDCFKDPPEYLILYEKIEEKAAGFIILGRTPLTAFSWDIYWIVVDKEFQGRGIGSKLIKKAEDLMLRSGERAVVRLETSTREAYVSARKLYAKAGYREVGTIRNFYAQDDGITIYSREISRRV